MCFIINKNYAGDIEIGVTNVSDASGLVDSPAKHADNVAVQNSGTRNVKKNGQGSAEVVAALVPQNLGEFMSAKSNLVHIVSTSVDTVLKQHKVKSEEKRIEIAMDVVDEVLRFIENPKNFKNKDEQ
jgi:hypothetical protein